jgi:hypothetical protein
MGKCVLIKKLLDTQISDCRKVQPILKMYIHIYILISLITEIDKKSLI